MIVFHIAMAGLAGLVGHQLKSLTDKLPNGISQIANYTLGSFLCLPFVAVIYRDLKGIRDSTTRLIVAYLLAFFGVGAGTVLGWLGWVELPGDAEAYGEQETT